MHPELWAAVTMLLPSVIAAAYMQRFPALTEVRLAGIGCFAHCPWSFMLHIYRALGTNHRVRTILYKLDVSFIHVHSLCQGYAWRGKHLAFDYILHLACAAYMWKSDPLGDPSVKMIVNVLVAVAVLQSSLGLLRFSFIQWTLVLCIWVVAFWIHCWKPFGPFSSAVFHALLAGPEWILLKCMTDGKQPRTQSDIVEDDKAEDEDEEEAKQPFVDMDMNFNLEQLDPLVEEPRKGLRWRFQNLRRVLGLPRTLRVNNVSIESL